MMPDPATRLNTALEGRYTIERELGERGRGDSEGPGEATGGSVHIGSGQLVVGVLEHIERDHFLTPELKRKMRSPAGP